MYAICPIWNYPIADAVENDAVVSDNPLLILTGTYDPITPASNGEHILAHFSNGQLIEFTNMGHDPASFVPECSGPIILGFLDDPFATVDGSCAAIPLDFTYPSSEATPASTPVIGS